MSGVSMVMPILQLLVLPFQWIANAVMWVKSLLFGSSFLHIAEGVGVVLFPLMAIVSIFEVIGKVVSFVLDLFKMLFSLVGGVGGGMNIEIGVAFGNVFAAISALGDAVVTGAVAGTGGAQVVAAGGGGAAFTMPFPVAAQPVPERERAGGATAAARPAVTAPRIVIVSQLVLDGTVIADNVQEHQAVEMLRFFNEPRIAMRGIATE
jgi:hypothetical protein